RLHAALAQLAAIDVEVIATVRQQPLGALAWLSCPALHWPDAVDQRQQLRDVVAGGGGPAGPPRGSAPARGRECLFNEACTDRRPRVRCGAPKKRRDMAAVDDRRRPVDRVPPVQPMQELSVQTLPNSYRLPVAQPAVNSRGRASELARQVPPGDARKQYEHDR